MRIVIDLQAIQSESRFRGIGRYSYSLARAMALNSGRHDVWLAVSGAMPESLFNIRDAFDGVIPPEKIRVFNVPTPVAEHDPMNMWRTRAAEKIREHFIQQLQPDIVHVASLFENPAEDIVTSVGAFTTGDNIAVTLYDLIPLLNEKVYLPNSILKKWYFGKIDSLKRAGTLLAISDYCRTEAIEALQLPMERVTNISAAIDDRFQKLEMSNEEATKLRAQYGIKRKMVMFAPGGFDARKNFDGLIDAYGRLPITIRAHHQLVIASKISDGQRSILEHLAKKANLGHDELVLTGYIPDTDLVKIYNLATLFVFPSKHEGFGLPALEAMACGVPTIGSATTSVPEVIGRPDALFDPNSPRSIADKMIEVLDNENMRVQLSEHGMRQCAKFSWDASAKAAIHAFEQQFEKNNSNPRYPANKIQSSCQELLAAIGKIEVETSFSNPDIALVSQSIAFNSGTLEKRQLLLDVSTIVHQDAGSGIQRVVRSLLVELLQNSPVGFTVRPIYFQGQHYFYANAFLKRINQGSTELERDQLVDFAQDDIYLSLDLNMHLADQLRPVHLRLKALGIYIFYIVYDILLIKRPDWWAPGLGNLFERWLHAVSYTATGFACISGAVADEVQEWLRNNLPDRSDLPAVSSFHLGADVENSLPTSGMPEDAQKTLNVLRTRPSFLMVGTLEPRKGHAQTLSAFELLWQQGTDVNLVIVGKRGWLVEPLIKKISCHAELGNRLFWLEGITDEYLKEVYANSTCLIAASEGEGFGLPLIEAAQHHVPIIARNLPVFSEVAGDNALFFDGLEAAPLARAIENWLVLYKQNQAPSSTDMNWLTWQQSAKQLLEGILPVASSPKTYST